ncbi:hypothetical protein BDC45DRAFT_507082 [Circinella umbellata]|nr:hypothetical protein BDC45DRAFT_507082 [Circinella umbellata]
MDDLVDIFRYYYYCYYHNGLSFITSFNIIYINMSTAFHYYSHYLRSWPQCGHQVVE